MDCARTGVVATIGDGVADVSAPALRSSETRYGSIRPLERGDLERVASLFISKFRRRDKTPRRGAVEQVAAYMDRLYLQGPFNESGVNSLVQVDSHGDIGGFLGLLKSRYWLNGEVLTAGIISTLMAAEGADHGRAGPQLLRSLNNSDLDLQLTDSANRTSLAFARPMKYELLPVHSMEWARAFRPAAMLADKMKRRWPRPALRLLKPFVAAADFLIDRTLQPLEKRPPTVRWHSNMIDAATFAEIAPGFLPVFRLRPFWAGHELRWLLAQAAEKRSNGPLHFADVRDGAGVLVGCYAFYGEAGGVAHVLQLLARDQRWGAVVDCLMSTAEDLGCIGVVGHAQDAIMPQLYTYPGCSSAMPAARWSARVVRTSSMRSARGTSSSAGSPAINGRASVPTISGGPDINRPAAGDRPAIRSAPALSLPAPRAAPGFSR